MGIVGPQIYNLKFGPTYRVSFTASIGILCGTVAALLLAWWAVARQRKNEDVERRDSDGSVDAGEWKET